MIIKEKSIHKNIVISRNRSKKGKGKERKFSKEGIGQWIGEAKHRLARGLFHKGNENFFIE